MTAQLIAENLKYKFPHLSALERLVLTQTVAPLSLLELQVLKLNHQDHAIMTAVIDTVIKQRELEAEIIPLEQEYQMWEDYRHCCGSW
jgi:hypothetical protein